MPWTTEQIRKEYPNPSIANKATTDYCVGGAFCRFMRVPMSGFPSPRDMISAIMKCTTLDYNNAFGFAWEIVAYNDAGYFNDAWRIVEKLEQFQKEC